MMKTVVYAIGSSETFHVNYVPRNACFELLNRTEALFSVFFKQPEWPWLAEKIKLSFCFVLVNTCRRAPILSEI